MAKKPRGVLIAGNWKMNRGPREAREFFAALAPELPAEARAALAPGADAQAGSADRLAAALFVPYLSLTAALEAAGGTGIAVGAQNAHWEKAGAFTGETSGPMLGEIGVRWALTGHSERRQHFGESDETVRRRTESLLEQGFRVVACIGETREERESRRTEAVLERQLRALFPDPSRGAAAYLDGRLILAYEPVWAIGTGLTATPEQAEEAHRFIREFLRLRLSAPAADRTPLLYGGSVTPENLGALLAGPNVDGGLVGGASLKPESYAALLAGGLRALS